MKRVLSVVFLLAIVFLPALESSAQELESPRLRALQEAIKQDSSVVDSFWKEVATKGTPLIERENDHSGHALVTFLWKAEPDTKHVFVDGQLGQLTGTRRTDNLLDRLGNTSVWYRSYWLRNDLRTVYRFGVNASLVASEDDASGPPEKGFYPDPFGRRWNPPVNPSPPGLGQARLGEALQLSVLEGPRAVQQPWFAFRAGVAAGQLQEITWKSTLLNNQRQVWVYTPAGYRTTGEPYDLVIATDGGRFVYPQQAPTTLDNLISDKRIPPVVAVFIGNAPNVLGKRPPRWAELTCNDSFVEFLAAEIVPWVRSKYHVTSNPARTVIAGMSYGGLNAAFTALRRPNLFGNVLSQSGSFWWRPAGDTEGEWLTKEYAAKPTAHVKFYMTAGLLEIGDRNAAPIDWIIIDDRNVPYGPTMLVVNRHMRDVLKLKGYSVHYAEFVGGHHDISWRGTFADGLIALIGLAQEGAGVR